MEQLPDIQVLLTTEEMALVEYIAAWHKKMMADSKSVGGLVDFHAREQQAHHFIDLLLSMIKPPCASNV